MLSDKNKAVIKILEESDIIPKFGLFDISEETLSYYVRVYNKLFSSGNQKFDYFYARKIAGLTLLKLKFNRGGTFSSCKEGIVYCIKNPARPDYLKVGMTVDLNKRLKSFQTGDPYRLYMVDTYEFCLDRKQIEKSVFSFFSLHLQDEGEWLKIENGQDIIHFIRNQFDLNLNNVKSEADLRGLTKYQF